MEYLKQTRVIPADAVSTCTAPGMFSGIHRFYTAGPDQLDPARAVRINQPEPSLCSVIRPSLTQFGGAVATIKSFTADHLFEGQSPEFFETVIDRAVAAGAAERQLQKG